MAIEYSRLATVAQRLINQNGRTLTILLKNRTPADSTKPWNGPNPAASTSISVAGIVVEDQETDAKGDLVRRGQMVAYIAALDTNPALVEQYDTLTDGANVWKIERVLNIAPGPTRVVYELKLGA